jgi:hypothetical protein
MRLRDNQAIAQFDKVSTQFRGGRITPGGIVFTGFQEHAVQVKKPFMVWLLDNIPRQIRESSAIETKSSFVQRLPQAVSVGPSGPRSFRRHIPWRANGRWIDWGLSGSYEPDIGQLGYAVNEDDVRRLNIAVNKAMLMKEVNCSRDVHTQIKTFSKWQLSPLL